MKHALILLLLSLSACAGDGPSTASRKAAPPPAQEAPAAAGTDILRQRLTAYLAGKKADVGVAILGLDDGDTLSVNGSRFYPLMSVAKFPQALLLLHLVDSGRISRSGTLHFTAADLQQRTASTIRKDHPQASFDLTIPEVLAYAMGQSDNITSNKMFEAEGGPAAVTEYVRRQGVGDVRIRHDYAHMTPDPAGRNEATPLAMVRLLELFYRKELLSDSSQSMLWKAMTEGTSGPDRLKGALPAGTVVAHKTGTSATDPNTGVTEAFNDIGIVQLPDGRHYAIAVFVAGSQEPATANAAIIADVCKAAWDYFTAKGSKR